MRRQMDSRDLAEHLDNFADLTPGRALEGINNGRTDLGTRLEGRLAGVPYDRAPIAWLCDREQWVAENSPYEVVAVAYGTRHGWYFGINIHLAETGEKIEGAGFEPRQVSPLVEDISYTPKAIYAAGCRVVDNVIQYMIEKGLCTS